MVARLASYHLAAIPFKNPLATASFLTSVVHQLVAAALLKFFSHSIGFSLSLPEKVSIFAVAFSALVAAFVWLAIAVVSAVL